MQAEQAEYLRQMIESSTILTQSEKTDWLDMLILMNDKQAAELQQILNAKPAMPPPPPAGPVVAAPRTPSFPTNRPSTLPPLSHISNLPADLNPPSSRPLSAAPPPPPGADAMPWQKKFDASVKEKELPAPKTEPIPRPVPPRPAAAPRPPAPRPPAPRPVPQRASIAPPRSPAPSQSAGPVSLETLADAGKLTLGTMRAIAFPDFLIRLQQLSKMEGYFNLLSYLEDSPLYKSYLETGKKVLAGQLRFDQAGRSDPDTLTKQEFEAFTDVLRKVQIN